MVKEIDMKVQETQGIPTKLDAKRPPLRHIKMLEAKEKKRTLEAAREK